MHLIFICIKVNDICCSFKNRIIAECARFFFEDFFANICEKNWKYIYRIYSVHKHSQHAFRSSTLYHNNLCKNACTYAYVCIIKVLLFCFNINRIPMTAPPPSPEPSLPPS